ncbi:MAG: putative Ig domain-containing protein [Planctomycetota bacterium]
MARAFDRCVFPVILALLFFAGCAKEDPPPQPLRIVTGFFPQAEQMVPYAQTAVAENGAPPYTWSMTGNLPTGLSLNAATGAITGTPTVLEMTSFTLRVDDTAGASDNVAFSITVVTPPLTITTKTVPYAMIGSAYNFTLQSIGGVTPLTWSIVSGTIPMGLNLDSLSGAITGTPAGGASPATIDVRVTDGSQSDTQLLAIEIDPVLTTIVTVRQDNTGDFTSITDAVNAIPSPLGNTHVIEIDDDNLYNENVSVNFNKQAGTEWVSLRSAYNHLPTIRAQVISSPVIDILTDNVEIRGLVIEGASQAAGIKVANTVFGFFTIYILNNVIVGNRTAVEAPMAQGVNIFNNTCYGDRGIEANGTPTVVNNIVFATGAGGWAIRSQNLTSDYNLLFAPNGIIGDDLVSTYATLSAWQSASGQDANSLSEDPLFVSAGTGDFHLQPASNARDHAPSSGSTPLTDANGFARGGGGGMGVNWDLGAYEDQQ